MAYPKRDNNHILDTECEKYFANCIPNEWCIDKPTYDYGIDNIVNIAINNQITGLNFSVQLKAVHKTTSKSYISRVFKQTTLNLYNTRLEPIMIVVYSQADKEAYWLWYNDLDVDLTQKQKSYSIRVSKANKLSDINWIDIIDYVKNIFSTKAFIDGLRRFENDELSKVEILAWKYYYCAYYDNAVFYLKKSVENTPSDLSLLEALAHSLYMTGNYIDALCIIDNVISISGTMQQRLLKASILTEDGIRSKSKNRLLEAKRIFADIIENTKVNNFIYHYNYANALGYLDENEDSVKHYKIALSLNPNYAEAWKNLGSIYYKLQKHEDEIKCYDNALSINPQLPQALFSKGITLSHIYKRHKEALLLMNSVVNKEAELINNFHHGFYWLAYVNEMIGDLQQSMDWINKGLSISPDDTYLLSFKCQFLSKYWTRYNYLKDEAVVFFETMMKSYRDYRSIYYYLIINDSNDNEIIAILEDCIPELKSINIKDIQKWIGLDEFIKILLHYHKYLIFRQEYPLSRYTSHFISGNFSVKAEFWSVIHLIFGYVFSVYIEYNINDNETGINDLLLQKLQATTRSIQYLIQSEDFTTSEIAAIAAEIFIEFPNMIAREFGCQKGHIAKNIGLAIENDNSVFPEDWFNDLQVNSVKEALIALGIPE